MTTLIKDGGTKTLSNEILVRKLLANGWVLKEESTEETPKKEVKNGKSRTTDSK